MSIGNRPEKNVFTVADKGVQPWRAKGNTSNNFAGIDVFLSAIDYTAIDQVHHGVGYHARMHTEIVFVMQRLEHHGRQLADAGFDG